VAKEVYLCYLYIAFQAPDRVHVVSSPPPTIMSKIYIVIPCCWHVLIQEGFAQTAALGVSVRSEGGLEAKVSMCNACVADLQRHGSESEHMRCLCSGFEAKVSICGTCAVDLEQH